MAIYSGVFYPNLSGSYCYGGFVTGVASGYYSPPRFNWTIPKSSSKLDVTDIPDHPLDKIPSSMLSQFTVNGKNIQLKQSDYKASGGEGVVYVKGGYAYKIYHDAAKMIPVGKIQELATINLPNVLGPTETIYHGAVPVGFVMRYVSDTEFLCKLFTKGFRDKNGISHDAINNLVKNMQETLKSIHDKKILVVDYNEMNFLVDKAYTTVYNIDVDSYKTPSYGPTAIMESIRDRKVKNNQWSELSDWFSFGVVAFQLYMGCHPYKGRHPDFAPKDWMKMMDQGVSVFNKKAKLPPATQTLDVIPKGHLRWFEGVFERGERSAPPNPDQITIIAGPTKTKIVSANDKFDITIVRKYDSDIQAIRYIDGICYVLTQGKLWADSRETASFAPASGYVARRTIKDLAPVQGDKPVIIELNKLENKLVYKTVAGKEVGVIESNGFFILNRCVYTVVRGNLVEISFINTGVKTNALQQTVANIFHNHQVFDGLVVQNMLDTCRVAIPFKAGVCAVKHLPELDKHRIIDAKFDSGVAIFLGEAGGNYDRFTFIFSKDFNSYTVRKEVDVPLGDINFFVKDNGACIAANDDRLEAFIDNDKVKSFASPLSDNEQLVGYKNDTYAVNGDTLYKVASK